MAELGSVAMRQWHRASVICDSNHESSGTLDSTDAASARSAETSSRRAARMLTSGEAVAESQVTRHASIQRECDVVWWEKILNKKLKRLKRLKRLEKVGKGWKRLKKVGKVERFKRLEQVEKGWKGWKRLEKG